MRRLYCQLSDNSRSNVPVSIAKRSRQFRKPKNPIELDSWYSPSTESIRFKNLAWKKPFDSVYFICTIFYAVAVCNCLKAELKEASKCRLISCSKPGVLARISKAGCQQLNESCIFLVEKWYLVHGVSGCCRVTPTRTRG